MDWGRTVANSYHARGFNALAVYRERHRTVRFDYIPFNLADTFSKMSSVGLSLMEKPRIDGATPTAPSPDIPLNDYVQNRQTKHGCQMAIAKF